MKKPHFVVCITCVGGRLIYDIISAVRDAEDYSVTVVGVDADPSAAGRLLCDHFAVLPMAEKDPEGWVKGIVDLKARLGVQGLICLSDQEARLAAQTRGYFAENGIHTSVSQWETVEVMTDKLSLLQTLNQGGVDAGPFVRINSIEDAAQALKELGYPDKRIVLKPRRGSGSRGVLVCDSAKAGFELMIPDRLCGVGTFEQIQDELAQRELGVSDWLAVPYWEGPVFDVECLVSNRQVVLSAARRRQLRNPFWPTSTGHLVDMHPAVLSYASQMCRALNVEGAGDFDIVLRQDGSCVVMDASARFSGSVGGSYTAGANFLAQLVRVMFGLPLVQYQIRDQTPLRPYITMAEIPKVNVMELL
jgi:carbamoyl-phosphate synthase large subunit